MAQRLNDLSQLSKAMLKKAESPAPVVPPRPKVVEASVPEVTDRETAEV